MKPFTPSEKKRIKKDWNESLPIYSKYKLNCIIKRNDPMVTGVYLHMGGSAEYYTPVFFMHNLMLPNETISLGGYGPMRCKNLMDEFIRYKRHSEKFGDIISEFQNQYPIAFLDYVNFEVVDSYYRSFIEKPPRHVPYPLGEMTDHLLLMFWYGKQHSEIINKIERYGRIQEDWPEACLAEERRLWKENVLRLMDHQELSRTVEREIVKLKIEKINTFPMKRSDEVT